MHAYQPYTFTHSSNTIYCINYSVGDITEDLKLILSKASEPPLDEVASL